MHDSALFELAQERFAADDLPAARVIVERLLATMPGDAAVLSLWMLILSKAAEPMAAITVADELLARDPAHMLAMTVKGRLLVETGKKAAGIAWLQAAGIVMMAAGREEEGCEILQSAIESIDEEPLEQWIALISHHQAVLSIENLETLYNFIEILYEYRDDYWKFVENFGEILSDKSYLLDALDLYKKSFALYPQNLQICNKIGMVLSWLYKDDEAMSWFRKADDIPHDTWTSFWKGKSIQYSDQGSQKELNRLWDRWGRSILADALPRPPMPPARRPLRLGFCSTMLGRDTVTDRLALHLASALSRRGVETRLYVTYATNPVPLPDMPGCQQVNLTDLGYPERAQIVRNDQLHALIEFDWPGADNFLTLYKYSPTPLVIGMLHAISSHGGATDCLIMDDWYCPPGREADYSERILCVKGHVHWPPPKSFAPEVAPPPCLTQGFITFGSFNRPFRLNEETLAAWAEVMQQVQRSRLLLHSPSFNDYETDRVIGILRRCGLAQERFEILGPRSTAAYLASYGLIDIALDPFSCNGGDTSLDALWQGVPLFTCPGRPDQLTISRMGASLLTAIGRPEWIARDPADWRRMVVDAASDYDRLRRWRFELRSQIARTYLCDAERRADLFLNAITPVIDERYGESAG